MGMPSNDHRSDREHLSSGSALGRFFRSRETGELAVVQVPNLPLAIFLAATAVRLVVQPRGSMATVVSAVATIGLVWWSVDEIARGDSPFRRVLGGVVLLGLVLGLVMR